MRAPDPIPDPTEWVLQNPFAEFLTSGTVGIKFMCMLGYVSCWVRQQTLLDERSSQLTRQAVSNYRI